MTIEIKSRFTGEVIKSIHADTLRRADLRGANLRGTNLGGANLYEADLRRADLGGADLGGANLRRANLCEADLRGANLYEADLRRADLRRADLRGADLRGADLYEADLRRASLPPFQIPQEGDLTVYKAVREGVIKLLVPARARRTASLVGRKCRAEYVLVLEGNGTSSRGGKYIEGQEYHPDSYDGDIRVECTHGVHFFLTREEAESYV